MPYTYVLMLAIGLFALVALLSLADAIFTQPAPPTVVVQLWSPQESDTPGTVALVLVLGVLVLLMLTRA
jgi:hypothetical protein